MKTLYFEGAGCADKRNPLGNCRIRTAFHLSDGRAVYLEILSAEKAANKRNTSCKWNFTGYVDGCYYITDDKPNDDCNIHKVKDGSGKPIEISGPFEYTAENILELVNGMGADFTEIKVLEFLSGYRVFPEKNSCTGPDGYYYGDEFAFNPELTAKRKEIYGHIYDLEKSEGKTYPNFSLWVDEKDPGLLHLLRHFIGFNKHWEIRVDEKSSAADSISEMVECQLGRYGC